MTSDDSDEEPLSTLAAFKRKQESEVEIIPVYTDTNKTSKKKKSTKKLCGVTIELARAESPPVLERPMDVWMYLKDLNPTGPYTCLLCEEWFINKTKIVIHYIVDHRKNFCGICRYFVTDDEAWVTHQSFHKPWTCSQCPQSFEELGELRRHFSEDHKLVHCRLCHTRMLEDEYNTHLFKKHNMSDVSYKNEDIFWFFENESLDKFKCFLCSKSNNTVKQFVNHYISFHHITLKCLAPLLCGKNYDFKIKGADLTPAFINDQLKNFSKFGYVDLEAQHGETIEKVETFEVKIKEETTSEPEDNNTQPQRLKNVVPLTTENPDHVLNVPDSYPGEEGFDVTLMEVIIIQQCYYDYLRETIKSIESNTLPNSTIDYEDAITDKLIDVECSLCSEKYTTLNTFVSHIFFFFFFFFFFFVRILQSVFQL